jgi:hypothetical protein
MAFMAAAAPYMMAASAGMSILGGVQQANAQRAAGDAAYANALQRARMAQIQAQQEYANASTAEGAGQVQAEQERQRATLLAGRAKAVMAASGAGVDPNLVASLIGQGNYNANVDLFNAGEKARNYRNQGAMDIYSGNSGIYSGQVTKNNDYAAADNTIIGSVAKGVLSFGRYYGAPSAGTESTSNIDSEIASWSQYGQDPASQAAYARVTQVA